MPALVIFERLSAKLAVFQASSETLRLLLSIGPGRSHWELHREHANEKEGAAAAEETHISPQLYPLPAVVGVVPKRSGSVPLALQSRLLVLDASFNPPTRAHAQMAKSAIRDVILEQRAAVAAAAAAAAAAATLKTDSDNISSGGRVTILPETRLLLLLAVNNADKPSHQPAPFAHRVAMMHDFAEALSEELSEAGHCIAVDVGVTTEAYFSDKAAAIAVEGWFTGRQGNGQCTFTRLDEEGNEYPCREEGEGEDVMGMEMPPMEFLTGFDTLVRIFNPKYYTDEGSGGVAEEEDNTPPSPASSTASYVKVSAPVTPMMKALRPFFEKASLRVMLRPNDAWGSREEQELHLAALAGRGRDGSGSGGGDDVVKSLKEIGGDVAWLNRVRLSEPDGNGEDVSGVSSSLVRKLVRDEGPQAVTGLVYPAVLKWIEQHELYKA